MATRHVGPPSWTNVPGLAFLRRNSVAPSVQEATATSVGAQMAVIGMMAVAQIVVARVLGAADYGLYGVMIGSIALNAALVNSGVVASLGKYVAEFDASGDDEGISAAFASALRFETVLLVLTTAVLAALAPILVGNLFQDEIAPYLVLIAGTVAFGSYAVFQGVLLGLREIRLIAMTVLAHGATAVVLMVTLVYVFELGINGAAVAYGISLLVLALMALIAVIIATAGRLVRTKRRVEGFASFSTVVTGNAFFDSLTAMALAPIVALLIADDQRELVGFTALLASLGLAASNLLLAGYRAAYPYMARWRAMGQHRDLSRLVAYALAVTVVAYSAGLVVGEFWGEQLIAGVYGDDFREAAGSITIAALAMGLLSLRRLVAFVLYSAGRQNQMFAANAIGAVVFLVCLLTLALGSDVSPIKTVFVAAIAGNATSLLIVAIVSYGSGTLGTDAASAQPAGMTATGLGDGHDYQP